MSFGEQDLMLDHRICGRVRVLSLSAFPAIYPRLGLQIGVELRELEASTHGLGGALKGLELLTMSGDLRLSEHGPTIGSLTWIGQGWNHRCRSSPFPSEDQLQFACDLDPWRLERIERWRNGVEPSFVLQLWLVIVMDGQRVPATIHPIKIMLPRERWLEFLAGCGYGSFEIIEVRFPAQSEGGAFPRAMSHLRAAQQQFVEGHFNDAAACSRRAMEALLNEANLPAKATELGQALVGALPEKRATAYGELYAKLKHAASLAQHDLGSSAPISRAEAQFIFRTTCSLVALIGELQKTPSM